MDTKIDGLAQKVDTALLKQVSVGKKSAARVLNKALEFISSDPVLPPPYTNIADITDANLLMMYRYNISDLDRPGRSPPSGGDQRGVGKTTLLTLEKYLLARSLITEAKYAGRFRPTQYKLF